MTKTMITEQIAKQRINRALKPFLHGLKTIRGRYYIVDHCRNAISYHDLDLQSFGKQLGAIKPWEAVDMSNNDRLGPVSDPAKPYRRADRGTLDNYFGHDARGKTWPHIDPNVIERLRRLFARRRRSGTDTEAVT
jgi:hypothetical protein